MRVALSTKNKNLFQKSVDKSRNAIYNSHIINKQEVDAMTEKEKKILETFRIVLPKLTDLEKEKLLSFGEGMVFKANQLA